MPHSFRPVHGFYAYCGWEHAVLVPGAYDTVFPCGKCYSSFETVSGLGEDALRSRCYVLRFHLASVHESTLTLELGVFP